MDFRSKFLSAIDTAATQAKSLVNGISDSFESIDFDSQLDYLMERRDALIEKGNSLIKDLGDLFKQVKDCMTDFSVTVPFDEASGEKYSYEIKDGYITIEVTFNDDSSSRSNTTTVAIPDNCDVSKVSVSTNTKTKSLTITIPKVVEKPKGSDEVEEPKKAKKLAKKVETTGRPAMKRDGKGRFVKQS
jgi:hypothetical protein